MKTASVLALIGIVQLFAVPDARALIVVEESAKLVLPDPNYQTVSAVAVDGNFAAVVSTRFFEPEGLWGNAVFLFERTGSSWGFRSKLVDERHPSDVRIQATVAIQGNIIAVARAREQTLFIYERIGTSWGRTAVLGRPPGVSDLGFDVEIDNGTVIMGAASGSYQGAAFRKNASGQWVFVGAVTAASGNGGGPDFVGGDVDIAGNLLAVASPFGCFGGCEPVPGEVWLFSGAPGAWSRAMVLTDPTGEEPRIFGRSIAMDSAAVLAGGNVNRGIHMFPADAGWTYDGALRSVDALMLGPPDAQGVVIATDGNIAVVGAASDDSRGVNSGSSLIYVTGQERPHHMIARLFASDSTPNLGLGSTVEISGGRVIVGTSANAVYIFDLPLPLYPVPEDPPTLQEEFEFDNGVNWMPIAGSSFTVVSNGSTRVYRQSSTTGNAGALLSGSTGKNQGIQADITPTAFEGADRWFGLAVRHADQNNFYYVTVRGTNVIQLRRMLNGSFVTLASANLPVVLNKTYRLRLEAMGRFLQVFVNGVPVLRIRDTALSQGLAGILMYKTRADYDNVVVSPNPAITMFADNFETSAAAQWHPSGVSSWSVATDGSKVYRQDSLAGTALSTTGTAESGNGAIQVRAKALAFDGADRWFGLVINYAGDQNYTYLTVRSNNTVSIRNVLNGQITVWDSAPFPVTTNTWYDLRLEFVRNSLRGYVNGKLLVERTAGIQGGHYGIAMHKTRAVFDDFSAVLP